MRRRTPVGLLPLLVLAAACGAAGGGGAPGEPGPGAAEAAAASVEVQDSGVQHVETDNDLPFQGSPRGDGIVDGAFVGPANNGLIGLGSPGGGPVAAPTAPEALRWLAVRQDLDGAWRHEGAGRDDAVDLTARVLRAFLVQGYTHRGDHDYARCIARGLRFLKNAQDEDGAYASADTPRPVETQARALLAMLSVHGRTDSPIFKDSAVRGLEALAASCERAPADLDRFETRHAVLCCLLRARQTDRDREARHRPPVFELDLEAWRVPALLCDAIGRADPVEFGLAALAALLFADLADPVRQDDVRRLVEDSLTTMPTWNATWEREGPSAWMLTADVCRWAEVSDLLEARDGWQETMRAMLVSAQIAGEAVVRDADRLRPAEDDEEGRPTASWDPWTLPGYAHGRVRLTAEAATALAAASMRPLRSR